MWWITGKRALKKKYEREHKDERKKYYNENREKIIERTQEYKNENK